MSMYLVLMVQYNRVKLVKAFSDFNEAASYADDMVMDLFGVGRVGTWARDDSRNVYEKNGKAVIVEPCIMPDQVDSRFKCVNYGVNLR